ncbi:MAG: M24 family metallopeptidase, partial [Brevinema sp.]
VTQNRMIKDDVEIEIIRQNTILTKGAYLYIQSVLKPGMTELEVAAELEYYCRKQGAEGMSFSTIIASGVRSSLPHGLASSKMIEPNDLIQLDFGIVKDHYCSDFSRVVALGQPDSQLMKAREIVEEALKNVYAKSECGMTGIEIDMLAREVFKKYDVEKYFVHGLGHSFGIEIHENPRLNTTWDKPITENMVLTIEPGLYFPNLGGIRLEDAVVMRADGFENITQCSYEA